MRKIISFIFTDEDGDKTYVLSGLCMFYFYKLSDYNWNHTNTKA